MASDASMVSVAGAARVTVGADVYAEPTEAIAILDTLPTVNVAVAVAVSPIKVWSSAPPSLVISTAVPACALKDLMPLRMYWLSNLQKLFRYHQFLLQ